MISENVKRYENVIIRNDKEVGINNFGLDYLVSLEEEIERLQSIIKEVREYTKEHNVIAMNKEYLPQNYEYCCSYELLEILDKENNND